jgi:hypothetical protein
MPKAIIIAVEYSYGVITVLLWPGPRYEIGGISLKADRSGQHQQSFRRSAGSFAGQHNYFTTFGK